MWSRRRFARETTRDLCAAVLLPYMQHLARLWRGTLQDAHETPPHQRQAIIDECYAYSCQVVRDALRNIACWSPTDQPVYDPNPTTDWTEVRGCNGKFVIGKLARLMRPARHQQRPDNAPTPQAFAEAGQRLFTRHADRNPFEELEIDSDDEDADNSEPGAGPDHDSNVASELTDRLNEAAIELGIIKAPWMKAIGSDNLPIDALKCTPGEAAKWMAPMFQLFSLWRRCPSNWRDALMCHLVKPDKDASDPDSYRTISIPCHLRKLYELVILHYMMDHNWLRVSWRQTGFQRHQSSLHAVYALDEVTQAYHAAGHPLLVAQLDIKKAFDTVDRNVIWETLGGRGVPRRTLAVLHSLYEGCTSTILVGGHRTSSIQLERGVFQGGTLSPQFYNVFIDPLIDRLDIAADVACPRLGPHRFPCAMLADDLTILSTSAAVQRTMLVTCGDFARENAFEFSPTKCVVMVPPKLRDIVGVFSINGEPLEIVDESILLGVLMREGLVDHDGQIRRLLPKAEAALQGLRQSGMMRAPAIPGSLKRIAVSAWVRSRYEYGAPIARYKQAKTTYDLIDNLQRRAAGVILGHGRTGTNLSLRVTGLLPAQARHQLLRTKFMFDVRAWAERHTTQRMMAARVYRHQTDKAVLKSQRSPNSVSQHAVTRCQFYKVATEHYQRLRQEYTVKQRLAKPDFVYQTNTSYDQEFRATAIGQTGHKLAWKRLQASKIASTILLHQWRTHHPILYEPTLMTKPLTRWMVNTTCPTRDACTNCDGAYNASRYHVARCTDAATTLAAVYDAGAHLDLIRTNAANAPDNVIDACMRQIAKPALDGTKALSDDQLETAHYLRSALLAIEDRCKKAMHAHHRREPP
jgi:hypothetical protein